MTVKPLVSVLVRSMDRPSLDRTLASIAAQDWPRLEIVVVAACGPVHRELPAQAGPHPLRLLRPARPLDRAAAANAALDGAQGEWLAFLDDDDTYLPGHITSLMDAAGAHSESRLLHAKTLVLDAHGKVEYVMGESGQVLELMQHPIFHLQACVFARGLCDEGVRFDEQLRVHEDLDFQLQCGQRTPLQFVDHVGSVWSAHAGNSGAGRGQNRNDIVFDHDWQKILRKWKPVDARLQAKNRELLIVAQGCMRERDAQGARSAAERALELRPRDIDTLNLAGLARFQCGDYLGARELVERALRIAPAHPALLRSKQYIDHALVITGVAEAYESGK